jgi:hypothetical protein
MSVALPGNQTPKFGGVMPRLDEVSSVEGMGRRYRSHHLTAHIRRNYHLLAHALAV